MSNINTPPVNAQTGMTILAGNGKEYEIAIFVREPEQEQYDVRFVCRLKGQSTPQPWAYVSQYILDKFMMETNEALDMNKVRESIKKVLEHHTKKALTFFRLSGGGTEVYETVKEALEGELLKVAWNDTNNEFEY